MVGMFGGEKAVHFSPKDLGLSVGISGNIFGQSGLDCYGQIRDELSGR